MAKEHKSVGYSRNHRGETPKALTFLPLFPLHKNSLNASVSPALAAEVPLSPLAQGYAAC